MRSRVALGAGLALAFSIGGVGCRPSAAPPLRSSVAVHDSAGIHIVQDTAAAWAPGQAWSVDSVLVDLGGADGAFSGFANPATMTRLRDGRIVVADAGLDLLIYFAGDGHFLYTVGSRGRAPGQFQSLWSVFRGAADSVVAYDIAASRATTFDPNGALVDTLTVPVPPGTNGYLPIDRSAVGTLTLLRNTTPVPFPGRAWSVAVDSGAVVRFSPTGVLIDSIGPFPVSELVGLPVPQAGGGTVMLPIDRPLGRKAAFVVQGDTVWATTGATPSIDKYVGGRHTGIIRWPGSLTVVSASLVAEYKRRRERPGAGPVGIIDSVFNASLDSVPISDYLPGTGRLLRDSRGDLWVQVGGLSDLAPGDASLHWNVLAPDGSWLGQVTLPPRFAVQEIGTDYLLGSWLPDSGGAFHVRLYRLTKPVVGGA
ncbi:MAG TPA: hypothetical protein VFI39_02430 [Gemmatimonadales bacterium]|nr:hypothetical protein [Gemmatimonadales bacterium]